MDIESTLSNLAVNEITLERNREDMALLDTKATAGGVITFNYNSGPDGRWEVEKYQNLIAAISRARNDVLVASRRGPANFAVVSPDVLTALEMSGKLSTVGTDVQQSAYVGRLLGSMDVYCDQYATSNHVTVGYKGPGEEDAGIFIAPYKPITITKATGQDDGQQRLFFHTRYGLADNPFGAANYYRKISVTNLPN
jgi:hypothetical protein